MSKRKRQPLPKALEFRFKVTKEWVGSVRQSALEAGNYSNFRHFKKLQRLKYSLVKKCLRKLRSWISRKKSKKPRF